MSTSARASRAATVRQTGFTRTRWGARQGLFLSLPAVLMSLLVMGFPIAQSAYLSLTDGSLLRAPRFVGLRNFSRLVDEPSFVHTLGNTVVWTVSVVFLTIGFALLVAIALNARVPGMALFRSLALAPWIVPPVIAGLSFAQLFATDGGLLNRSLLAAGLIDSPIPWLGRPSLAMLSVVVAKVWKSYPQATFILLAGLKSIPMEVYEAATVDGVSRWRGFTYVTLPLLKGHILVASLLQVIFVFNSFDVVYVLTGGGPAQATQILGLLVYLAGFQWLDIGYATAVGMVMVIFLLLFFAAYLKVGGRPDHA